MLVSVRVVGAGVRVTDGLHPAGRELAGEHDATTFPWFGEVLGNLRMVGANVTDEAGEEALRLQARA